MACAAVQCCHPRCTTTAVPGPYGRSALPGKPARQRTRRLAGVAASQALRVTAPDSLAAYLTDWQENAAAQQLRETTHISLTAVVEQYLLPGAGGKELAEPTAKNVRTSVPP
ncbi:hypothetical protein [Streptomyces sp. NPDC051286]|uniref:hypothetical protein n=1 Tax=Streptomyces sp. NPDC051286 TaxID=3365647 RepID=UPI00378F9F6A